VAVFSNVPDAIARFIEPGPTYPDRDAPLAEQA
jgi:hypothetical protein